ncbi:lipopolysaccharide biosynthesis protein [Planococcus sp. CAU13]|uniref:lipopolysaccharide biosynthesis protein n=1 Tax=Planococcus sp. CAU13 TaxID=1541197 RepID=UPI00052FEDA7|nr:MATE family efflux transporter [Planococcus sp. CAU13]
MVKIKVQKAMKNTIIKNIFGLGIYRILGVITNFLLLGIIYRYLPNEETYGIWLTVFSILSWLALFDFGMGNSLRNKLTEALSNENYELAKKYISTTYIIMIIPSFLMLILAFVFVEIIEWKSLFNIQETAITEYYLKVFILTVALLYIVNFYLSILFALLHATYKSYLISAMQLLINVINIILVLMLYFIDIDSLLILGITYLGSSIIVSGVMSLFVFNSNKQVLKPQINFFQKSLLNDILNFGLKFLVLQMAIIVLFNTDNLLISKFISVKEVTPYQLIYKLLSIFTIILSIILTPIWTLIINYNTQQEFKKIREVFRKLFIIYGILMFGVIIIGLISPHIIKIWIGEEIFIHPNLILSIIIFTAMHMWCNIFQAILNGMNKLNVQMYSYGIATIINIPISIYLVLNTGMGVTGIVIGTIISLSFPSIILPWYTLRNFRSNE